MNQRFYSLDVFRGATVALMILVNNPGSWNHIYPPLEHAAWHGVTLADFVFPFFLFAVGNAMAFVIPKLEEKQIFSAKVIKRTVLIFLIGVFLNWFPFVKYNDVGSLVGKPFENLRFFGVLQRIALSYFFAAIIIHFLKVSGAFVASACTLLVYWFASVAANPLDPFSLNGWMGRRVDLAILGDSHMYHGEGIAFDPEGLMSTVGAVVQVIFGYIAGNYILQKGKTHQMLNALFAAAGVLIFTGFAWDMLFPINKKIWSSSYTVYTTGLALFTLSLMIYLLEFKKTNSLWSRFCEVFGKNALFIFVLSGLLPRLLGLVRLSNGLDENGKPKYLSPFGWFYEHVCRLIFPSDLRMGSLFYAVCFISMMWFFAWVMDSKKIYVKV